MAERALLSILANALPDDLSDEGEEEEEGVEMYEEIPEISYWRHSLRQDVPFLLRMFRTPQTYSMFGSVDVELQLELAHTALTQINTEGNLVSYIALFEYPNIPVVPSFAWIEWIRNLYGSGRSSLNVALWDSLDEAPSGKVSKGSPTPLIIKPISPSSFHESLISRIDFVTERNTLFIHLLLWKKRYSHDFLLPLLKTVFLSNVHIQQIVLILPPLVALPDVLEEFFMVENPLDPARSDVEMNTLQRLAICLRHSIAPRFMMRKAVESDHDDIAPIFNKFTKRFVKKYGKYYVAEIIAHPTKGRECIVGERNQEAVGMMCLNSDINLGVLNDNFELAAFNGLHKWDEEDYIPFPDKSSVDSREYLRLTSLGEFAEFFQSPRQSRFFYVEQQMKLWPQPQSSRSVDVSIVPSASKVTPLASTSSSSSEDFYLESIEETTLVKDRFFDEEGEDEAQQGSADLDYSPITTRHRNTIVDLAIDAHARSAGTFQFPTGPRPSTAQDKFKEAPEYFGDPNAFSIEMFGLRSDFDERLAFDFLEAAFDCFPKLDYAIITTKPEFPAFPLLQHFVRVTPHKEQAFPHELFVAHRSAVLGNVAVRHAEWPDLVNVKALMSDIEGEMDVVERFMSSIVDFESPYRTFVMTVEGVIVGLAVLEPVYDLVYMRSHYDLDALADLDLHKAGTHATLLYFVLCPPFEQHGRFFLREMQRQCDVGCLYHRQPARRPRPRPMRVVVALTKMLAVRPRRGIQYVLDLLDPENHPHEQVLRPDDPFSLYFINKRLANIGRRHVTLRIVVVGASDTGMAFLEALVLGPMSAFMIFHNLTLVSVHGLPDDYHDNSACSMMIPFRGRYNTRYLARLQLRIHVNVIYGAMTAIHRKRKLLLLATEQTVPYDYLVLCCGKQFQRPTQLKRLKRERQRGRCFRDRKRAVEDEAAQEEPLNVFMVNTPMDAANALTMLHSLMTEVEFAALAATAAGLAMDSVFDSELHGHHHTTAHAPTDDEQSKPPPTVIVYGHCLEALSCIATLLVNDIPIKFITVVEAFPAMPSISCLNDAEVDDAVIGELKDLNIKVISHCTFSDWKYDMVEKKVTEVTFESRTEMITMDCIAMFCYDEKSISTRTFLALNKASLVFDGHLVINNRFRTNDPYILAGGSMTKYARRYYAEKFRQQFFNSVEIGTELARELLKEIDPELEYALRRKYVYHRPAELDSFSRNMTCFKIPKFLKPLITCTVMPGGYNYLQVTAPGSPIPLEVAMSQDSYGQVLVTGDCKSEQGYFRLHFNANNIIESVTCYTRANFAVQNIIQLYGKHERVLNNVMERFELGYILDFYDYFDEPWACMIFHDRFNWLEVFIQEFLANWPLFGNASVMDELARLLYSTKDKKVIDRRMMAIEKVYTGSKVEKLVAQEVLKFIDKNSDALTMYAHPMRVREVLRGSNYSPFFKSPKWKFANSS